jgi:hypothetical protein
MAETHKVCRKCGEQLILEAFGRDRSNADGRAHWCRDCSNAYARERHRRLADAGWRRAPDLATRYGVVKANAAQRGLAFSLTRQQFAAFWAQPCHYCGTAIVHVSLDRVDNARGYEPDNVVPCCWHCNHWKSNMDQAAFREHLIRTYQHFVLGRRGPPHPAIPVSWGRHGRPRIPS